MNNEFKRMQQLAGIKEITLTKGNVFRQIFDKWLVDSMISQAEPLEYDAPEAAEYLYSLKQNPPIVNTLEQAVEKIIEIHEELNDLVGEYPGSYYWETIKDPLNEIGEQLGLTQYTDLMLARLDAIYDK